MGELAHGQGQAGLQHEHTAVGGLAWGVPLARECGHNQQPATHSTLAQGRAPPKPKTSHQHRTCPAPFFPPHTDDHKECTPTLERRGGAPPVPELGLLLAQNRRWPVGSTARPHVPAVHTTPGSLSRPGRTQASTVKKPEETLVRSAKGLFTPQGHRTAQHNTARCKPCLNPISQVQPTGRGNNRGGDGGNEGNSPMGNHQPQGHHGLSCIQGAGAPECNQGRRVKR